MGGKKARVCTGSELSRTRGGAVAMIRFASKEADMDLRIGDGDEGNIPGVQDYGNCWEVRRRPVGEMGDYGIKIGALLNHEEKNECQNRVERKCSL